MNPPSTEFVQAVFAASWQGGLVILLILLLRPVLGVWIPARWRALLWMLVLLRLLVPAFLLPPSPASLQNIAVVDRPFEEATLAIQRTRSEVPAAARIQSQGPAEGEMSSPSSEAANTRRNWWSLAAAVWAVGCGLSAAWIIAGTLLLQRRLRADAREVDADIHAVWERCCSLVASPSRQLGGGRPRLLQTSAVNSPALLGLFRPVLLIPRAGCEALTAEDWEHIFLHELAHFRRNDHWLQAVQLLALCAHWFNPLVWVGFRFLRADRELAADEWALQRLGGERPAAYGATLLKMLTSRTSHTVATGFVGIMEDGAQMKQRFRHVVRFVPRRLAGSAVGILLVLALAAVVLGRQPTNMAAYQGLSPLDSLVTASRRGDQAAVKQLLDDGVDINGIATSLRGDNTPLTAAIAANQAATVRLLVARGASVKGKATPPILVAFLRGHRDHAEFLLNRGAPYDPETLATANGEVAAVEAYLSKAPPTFEKLKLLGEVAAANGHRALFSTLYDELRGHPQSGHFPFSRDTYVIAVARGHREIVEEMLQRDPNLKPGDSVNRLAAAAAVTPGMREWLNSKGVEVPEYNDGERLITAAESEDLPEIRRLLQAGVDVNYRGESAWTPLTKAVVWGSPRAVTLLLQHRAEPNPPRYSYSTLELAATPEIADMLVAAGAKVKPEDIDYSVTFGPDKMVRWFLDRGVNPAQIQDGKTLLFDAGSPKIVDLLVARGVNVHARDETGRTALHAAIQRTSPAKIVTALLKHGADPNARIKGGFTPLMLAEDGPTVDALVAGGANLHATNDQGEGVLYAGWGSGIPSRIEALARHGLRLDPAKTGELLVNAIVLQRNLGAVKKLLALGADPNSATMWEGQPASTPLSAAIGNGEYEMAKVLRAAGANDVGELSEAASKGDISTMSALIDKGANINELSGGYGDTPLCYAVRQGRAEAVHFLLSRGANVNIFSNTGYTALSMAFLLQASVAHGNYSPIRRLGVAEAKPLMEEIIAAILQSKPDPNFRDRNGETALMVGAARGNVISVEEGTDVNLQRPDGMTALMIAVATQPKNASKDGPGSVGIDRKDGKGTHRMSSRAHVVSTLIGKGADLSFRNNAGKTALDLARENGNEEILALLADASR